MPDKQLTLNQQLALMPVAIPDSVIDFLEDFNYATALQTDSSRTAFDPDYLKVAGDSLKADLEKLRAEIGAIKQVQVEQAGREVPGGFLVKLTTEKGARGVGLLTRLKERTLLKVVFVEGEYDENKVREQIRNPK